MSKDNKDNDVLSVSHRIDKGEKTVVEVLGVKFKIGDIARKVLNNITDLQFRVHFYEDSEKIKTTRKRLKFINNSDAMVASYILLNKLSYIPLLHSIHWRIINMRYTSEHFNAIIECGLNNKEYAFFLKNSMSAQNTIASRMQMVKMS